MIVARFDHATRRYVVAAEGDRSSMSFAHPFAAANVGIVVAGELPSDEPKPVPSVFVEPLPSGVAMKTMRIVLSALSLAFVAACDLVPTDSTTSTGSTGDMEASTGEDNSSGSSSTGDGFPWTCPEIGAPCRLGEDLCAEGLMCLPINPGDPKDKAGACVVPCGDGCQVGECNERGFCDDADGLPTGPCGGLPQCAGDQCEDACDNGLECIHGACAMPCVTLADCPADATLCYMGACMGADGLSDVCG